MAKRIRINGNVALSAFDDIVPMQTIVEINKLIDCSNADLIPIAQVASMAVGLLRQIDAFRQIEEMSCANTRAVAAQSGRTNLCAQPDIVLRCVSLANAAVSHGRHFDSHLLTLLIPLQLAPNRLCNGDLVVYKRPRLSVSTVGNMMSKLNHGAQRCMPFRLRKWLSLRDLQRGRCARVPVEVGSVYEFNGFALQHANLDVEEGQRRTLLLHYYDPGYSLGVSAMLRRWRTASDRPGVYEPVDF
jgi:hypothetical protein